MKNRIRGDRGLANILCLAHVSMEGRDGLNGRHPTILKYGVGCMDTFPRLTPSASAFNGQYGGRMNKLSVGDNEDSNTPLPVFPH
jgi:hypothetical protein